MSNQDWTPRTDPDARIAERTDGRTRLACTPERVVDLETCAIVAAAVHGADVADPASVEASLAEAEANPQTARGNASEATPAAEPAPMEDDEPPPGGPRPRRKVVADKGYDKAALLRQFKTQRYRTYIPERRQAGRRRWTDKGGAATAVAFHQNRARGLRPHGQTLSPLAGRAGGARLRPCLRNGRSAPDPFARAGERGEALPPAGRRGESGPGDAAPARPGHPARMGGPRAGGAVGPSWFCD